jgi:hypothetical protein
MMISSLLYVHACVEDCPDGNFETPSLLTFHTFKTDTIIACPLGGTAAEPVELADKNETANNPSWDLICSNCKDQCMVDKQLACRGGRKILGLKRQTELAQQLVRQGPKKQKQKQIKAIHQTMETANKLQMAQLNQLLGEEGNNAREILQSLQNGVNKLEVMSSEEEGNESDKETTTNLLLVRAILL